VIKLNFIDWTTITIHFKEKSRFFKLSHGTGAGTGSSTAVTCIDSATTSTVAAG